MPYCAWFSLSQTHIPLISSFAQLVSWYGAWWLGSRSRKHLLNPCPRLYEGAPWSQAFLWRKLNFNTEPLVSSRAAQTLVLFRGWEVNRMTLVVLCVKGSWHIILAPFYQGAIQQIQIARMPFFPVSYWCKGQAAGSFPHTQSEATVKMHDGHCYHDFIVHANMLLQLQVFCPLLGLLIFFLSIFIQNVPSPK